MIRARPVKLRAPFRSERVMPSPARAPRTAAPTHATLSLLFACSVDVSVAGDTGVVGGSTTELATSGSSSTEVPVSSSEGDDESSASSSEGPADGAKFDIPTGDVGTVSTDCVPDTDVMFVLGLNDDEGRQTELRQFDPAAPELEWITDLDCLPLDNFGDTPASLGVERDGRVLISGIVDDLWTLDLHAPDPCATLAMIPWSPPGWTSLGFATRDEPPHSDRLYTYSSSGGGIGPWSGALGWADPELPGVPVTAIGPGPVGFATLAGTGDGRVFALGSDDQIVEDAALMELDPETGTIAQMLAVVPSGHVGFYGGDLFVFDLNQLAVGQWAPRVLRYDLDDDDGNGEHELDEIFGLADDPPNFWIRGVASPTCIPLVPPG